MKGRLSGIYVHPIKSCRAVACDTGTVSTIGLHGDRIWQVVDAEDRGVTQRRHRVSDLTGEAVRLVAMVSGCGWRLPGDLDVFGQNAPFSDAAPVLVTAESSLTWLCERASEPFGMDRFRPNLGCSIGPPGATLRMGDEVTVTTTAAPVLATPAVSSATRSARR